jgi:hypothetical protein
MATLTEQQINRIYSNAEKGSLEQLLKLCLDPDSGITIDGLKKINYSKIEQLEKRYDALAEEMIWSKSQGSIDALTQFIEKCQKGKFSSAHLQDAIDQRKALALQVEEKEWEELSYTNDIDRISAFVRKCKDGIYTKAHLEAAMSMLEGLEWPVVKASNDVNVVNAYIQKCISGEYQATHLEEAKARFSELANGSIVQEWNTMAALHDTDAEKLRLLNEFIQKYAMTQTDLARDYMTKANKLMERIRDAESARKDWIDARNQNSILSYVRFISRHPYSEYREEADMLIKNMKGNLLTDMKRYPFQYPRDLMYELISTNALTMEDLVDNSHTLTDRAYSHIKRFPTLKDEQRALPVASNPNPVSEPGNTDVYFFGVPGSGKTCVLAGLMALSGQLGFRFDPMGPGGGGMYASEIQNYARSSMLPPKTQDLFIQVIDAQINDENGNVHKLSMIEMAGERTAQFAAIDNPTSLSDLGPGAEALLSNDNNKVFFFVIDPTNDKDVTVGDKNYWVKQSNVLNCVSSLISKNKDLMKKVVAIHIILTKSDTLGEYVDQNTIQQVLCDQGYQAVLADLKDILGIYDINKQTGFKLGLYPFCIGRFMAGDVYTFDETDSLKILRVIQHNSIPQIVIHKNFFHKLKEFFNS